ncbi:histone deacetylase family protein [Aestuariibius sp. 2305UL40-4]|uniref:histone deacetylase family protein n=1 Tax=Aestuariibius violaceus TaxID=3234132 RepID=UPI00345E6430
MATALISHKACLGHVTPPGHPERVARLETVLAALELMDLVRVDAPFAAEDDVLRAHPKSYLDHLAGSVPENGLVALDPDTFLSPQSLEAGWRAAGAVVKGVDMVMGGEVANAFCAVRPPGHHAEQATAMGFCLLGSVAIASKHALDHHGANRVAVIDFDVHHGNGTQALLEDDPRILFCSTHQVPLFPGTGEAADDGPHGTVLNLPLRRGCSSGDFRAIVSNHVVPRVEAFSPDLILVSAGFDAHQNDPLAETDLDTEDFRWITGVICDLAEKLCGGRVVSSLEGGYDLDALAASVRAHVEVLEERGR